ncbi:hypothetical protein GCM10027024_20440 [Microbacterium insulae]
MQALGRASDAALGQEGVQSDQQIEVEAGEQGIGHGGVFLRTGVRSHECIRRVYGVGSRHRSQRFGRRRIHYVLIRLTYE